MNLRLPKLGLWLLPRLGLLCLGGLIALGAAEVVVGLVPARLQPIEIIVPDPVLAHRLPAGKSVRHRASEYDTVYKINSLGLRDREYTVLKRPGTFRILLLGDSWTMGWGVPLEKTFGKYLEGLLGERVEVINGGVFSYSPIVEFLWLKELMVLEPDIVIVTLSMDDAWDDHTYSSQATFDSNELPLAIGQAQAASPSGETVDYGLRVIPYFLRGWLSEHSSLYRYAREVFRRFKPVDFPVGDIRVDRGAPVRPDFPLESNAWDLSQRYVLAMRDLLQTHRVPLVVVVAPWGNQVDSAEWDWGRKWYGLHISPVGSEASFTIWQRFGEREGVPVLSLLEALRRSDRKPLYFSYDGHWNAEGHQVVAEALERFLGERNLVPRRG